MRRRYFPLLCLAALLLSGCLSGGAGKGMLTVELRGELQEHQEILVSNDKNQVYLVNLGSKTMETFALEAGTWWLNAFSWDANGKVVSASEPHRVRVKGGRERLVEESLVKTTAATTGVRPEGVQHRWPLTGGIELTWQYEGLGAGIWEVWERRTDGVLWRRVAQVPHGERSLVEPNPQAYEYIYALRYVEPSLDGVLPSPLTPSEGSRVGTLEVTWNFAHYFAPVFRGLQALQLAEDRYLVPDYTDFVAHFRSQESFQRRHELLASLGLEIKGEIPLLLAVLVEPGAQSHLAWDEWSGYSDAHLFLEPNWITQAWALPINGLAVPWYLDYARVPGAQAVTLGSQNVRIAVLDSGLAEGVLPESVQVVPGYNFIGKNYNTHDDYAEAHGTKISQLISEVMPVATLQPVKVLDSAGYGTDFSVSEGILFAAGLHSIPNPTPCQIINMSLGQKAQSELLRKQVEAVATQSDVVMIAASGNTPRGIYTPGIFHPAAYPQVVAVGAITPAPDGPQRADYSHYGPNLDLTAPPSNLLGTSFSTAIVSGVAGLMLANGAAPGDVQRILTRTATDIGAPGWDQEHGYGLVNGEWAVKNISVLRFQVTNSAGELMQEDISLEVTSKRLFLPPGEYEVEAWVNVQNGPEPRPGDYLVQSKVFVSENQQQELSLTLEEIGP